ncbi:hypothetical protein [Psychroserpens ponticola]|uniref:Outer membrane protein beta-barrel domain-containing protein n=1 Tax=Psychroserpens ponticola TaxID=2932268 RepID=A0ABY7RXZ5_9FLAO|nr:hypothetical protein [Psychroserpens ponticola]WCO01111.1 hypothetical protein MUN68_013685 [Psychroserpens ponticola]
MKKQFIASLFCISILYVNGQEFRVNDIQFLPLSIFHIHNKNGNFDTGGLHFGLDVGIEIFKQDIRLQLNTGSNINILGTSDDSFYSINVLYEKSPKILNWMETDIYAGIGFQHQSYTKYQSITINSSHFNIPVGLRFMFLNENRISLGLQSQSEFNKNNITLIYSTVIRYNFKNKKP